MGNSLNKSKQPEQPKQPVTIVPEKKKCTNCQCPKDVGVTQASQTPAAPPKAASPTIMIESHESAQIKQLDTKVAEPEIDVKTQHADAQDVPSRNESSAQISSVEEPITIDEATAQESHGAQKDQETQVNNAVDTTQEDSSKSNESQSYEPMDASVESSKVEVKSQETGDSVNSDLISHEITKSQAQKTVESAKEFSIANQKRKLDTLSDVEEYLSFIKSNPGIKVIALNGNTLGVEASKAMAQEIEGLDEIEEFYLNDCFTGRMKEEVHVCVEAFTQVLKKKTSLRTVDFSDNAFGPIGARAVAVLLSEATNLQELVLNNNGLGPEGGKIIAQALVDCQKLNESASRPSALRRVEIGRNRLENGSSSLMSSAFQAHGLIEEIALPQNGIRPEGIVELSSGIAGCVNLLKLNLQDNTFTSSGSAAFAVALQTLKALQHLNIGDCLLGSEGCEKVISALVDSGCPLESLNLQYNEMNEEGLKLLAKNLSKFTTIKVLMLNGNCFNPVGEGALALKETLQQDQRADILDSWSDMEWYSDEEEDETEEEGTDVEVEAEIEDEIEMDQNKDDREDAHVDRGIKDSGLVEDVHQTEELLEAPSTDQAVAYNNETELADEMSRMNIEPKE